MAENMAKKQFVVVDVEVIVYSHEDVLTTSGFGGVYCDFGDWGGLKDIW